MSKLQSLLDQAKGRPGMWATRKKLKRAMRGVVSDGSYPQPPLAAQLLC